MATNKKFEKIKKTPFSKTGLVLFLLIFAAIGGYLLLHSYAYTTNSVAFDGANNTAPDYRGSNYVCGKRSGYPAYPTITFNNRPTFNVAANGGLASYEWYVDGVKQAGTVHGDGFGLACFTLDHTLSDGPHSFYAVELAPHAGNHTTPDPFNFTVDSVGPPAPSSPGLASYVDGGLPGDNITKYRNLTFTGTSALGTSVQIFIGASNYGGGQADSSGHWLATTTALADGTYDIYAIAFDHALNPSPPTDLGTITIENIPPTAPSMFCYTDYTDFSASFSWAADSTDNNGIYAYTLYRDDISVPGHIPTVRGTFNQLPFQTTFSEQINQGHTYNYVLKAMDVAGNETPAAQTITIPAQNNAGKCGSSSGPIPGDVNSDGIVNGLDVSYVLSHWESADATGDLNHDGTVNGLDLSTVLSHWGG